MTSPKILKRAKDNDGGNRFNPKYGGKGIEPSPPPSVVTIPTRDHRKRKAEEESNGTGTGNPKQTNSDMYAENDQL